MYGYSHDYGKNWEDDIATFNPTDCANFVSLALYDGGVRDPRQNPFINDLITRHKVAADYEINYWDKSLVNKKLVEDARSPSKTLDNIGRMSWINVNELFLFLTKVLHFQHYTYRLPPRFHKGSSSSDNPQAWLDFLSKNTIQKGDVVLYNREDPSTGHAALIVDTNKRQTFYEAWPDKVNYDLLGPDSRCDNFPDKPRVIERSGNIDYLATRSRSIDNTSGSSPIITIDIIHIPDYFPGPDVYP